MTKREQFLLYCMQFIGIPYIWGGGDPRKGLDCSGLIQILLSWWHLDPAGDQTAHSLYLELRKEFPVISPQSTDEFGWLNFYGPDSNRITHVSLSIGNGLIIEAGGGGSECTSVKIALEKGAKVRVKQQSRVDLRFCIDLRKAMS
jgi:cell wall-associated NlpC family hydrolase